MQGNGDDFRVFFSLFFGFLFDHGMDSVSILEILHIVGMDSTLFQGTKEVPLLLLYAGAWFVAQELNRKHWEIVLTGI